MQAHPIHLLEVDHIYTCDVLHIWYRIYDQEDQGDMCGFDFVKWLAAQGQQVRDLMTYWRTTPIAKRNQEVEAYVRDRANLQLN